MDGDELAVFGKIFLGGGNGEFLKIEKACSG